MNVSFFASSLVSGTETAPGHFLGDFPRFK